MDKAPAYGAGDSGFESQYGLIFFCLFFTAVSWSWRVIPPFGHGQTHPTKKKGDTTRGDARIELATSCTRSRNHTTRPITQLSTARPAQTKKRMQGHAGVEPATYRAATDCSTTELTPRHMISTAQAGKNVLGGAGYRSLCLLHAKQALYHLSYTPNLSSSGGCDRQNDAPTGSRTRR